MTNRDPILSPKPGDIVRSCYDSIGERHVLQASDANVRYYRVRPNGARAEVNCLPSIWAKWCRSNRVEVIQRGV